MEYTENNLVAIARRENNKKRNYLIVNPLQGKHIPVSPGRAFALFEELANRIRDLYSGEKLLLIGFAETATAIGAHVAACLGAMYIQTTREVIQGADYLFFSEEHSHATEQKLVKDDIDSLLPGAERIIFIEDELTTGKTILNIIHILEKTYPRELKFSVASLLNGMNRENLDMYEKKNINIQYIVKTNHEHYPEMAQKFADNGKYADAAAFTGSLAEKAYLSEEIEIPGWIDTRRAIDAGQYIAACESLWKAAAGKICDGDNETGIEADKTDKEVNGTDSKIHIKGKKYLVMGTEEFMYPALYIGKKIEELGGFVRSHSTTRSPIMVSRDDGYPLQSRYELRSLYDSERVTYIYNLDKYDKVVILTDSHNEDEAGVNSLLDAVGSCNSNITIIRWR